MNITSNRQLQKPRMRDIARKAGVSLGTVSRVMNGNPEVDPELVERVINIARQVGYLDSRSIIDTELGAIGYLVDTDTYDSLMTEPFQQRFLWGVEQAASTRGGHVVFASCREDIQRNVLPSMVTRRLVQGIVIKPTRTTPEPWIKALREAVPTVMLMHRTTDHSVPSVMCDNEEGMYRALAQLKALGHTRIGFFSEDDLERTTPHHLERQDAFTRLQASFGLTQHPGYIQTPVRDNARGEDLEDVVQRGLRNFLALGSERPTAIVGAADVYALSILKALPSFGLSAPEDLSVIGFMNTLQCDFSTPPLSSISLSEEEIGRVAVDLLQRRIASPQSPLQHITVGTQLIERMSCASRL